MKKISVVIPTYNEELNVKPLSKVIVDILETKLSHYDYEIIFIDNDSKDNTRQIIQDICSANHKIKAIFNTKNFGQSNSPFYGLCASTGDCTILICADFQDPVELLPQFVKEWENGYKIVCGIKSTSEENKIIRFLRTCYYKTIRKMSTIDHIEHFTGFGLYDKEFISVLKQLDDPAPYLRGIVSELGPRRKDISYKQNKRLNGKTSNNLYTLYDLAMLGVTSYTKAGLRIATILGAGISCVSMIVAIIYFIFKLMHWDDFQAGIAPIIIGIFFFGSLQLFFIGLIGEYILSINTRVMKRPLVIEEKRINFDE